jgi:hypothetical protein
VTDAYKEECECPVCILKKAGIGIYNYILGHRYGTRGHDETNEKGFFRKALSECTTADNRLGLGLIIDTHLVEQNFKLRKLFEDKRDVLKKDSEMSLLKNISNKVSPKQTGTGKFIEELIGELSKLEEKCAICSKLDYTMDRYIDVILYLWFKEEDFKRMFQSKKGFA